MKQHVSRVISSCFFQLTRLRQIRRSAGEEVTKRLVTALVLSRLDYCNAALAGLPSVDRSKISREGVPTRGTSMPKTTRGESNVYTRLEEKVEGGRAKLTCWSVGMW